MSEETVDKLIAGQESIDRMKGEIKSVISTVRGLLGDLRWEKDFQWSFPSPDHSCIWVVILHSQDGFSICWNSKTGIFEHVFSSDTVPTKGDMHNIRLSSIAQIRASLGVLVDGLMQIFPALGSALQPLLDVADK